MEINTCENCGSMPEGFLGRVKMLDGKPCCSRCAMIKSGKANYLSGKHCPFCKSETLVFWRSRITGATVAVGFVGGVITCFFPIIAPVVGFVISLTFQEGFRCGTCKQGFYAGETTEEIPAPQPTKTEKVVLSVFHWTVVGVLSAILIWILWAFIFL